MDSDSSNEQKAAQINTAVSGTGALEAPFDDVIRPKAIEFNPVQPAINIGSDLSQAPQQSQEEDQTRDFSPGKHTSRQRLFGMSLLVFGCVAALVLGIRIEANKSHTINASLTSTSAHFKTQTTALSALGRQLNTPQPQVTSTLTVNGKIDVSDSIVLEPTGRPANAVAGQLFYNQTANQMQYYDGTGFVALQGGVTTTNIYNSSTTLGGNTYVTNNSGVSIKGTAGSLAMFGSSGGTLTDSLISQAGTILNVGQANAGNTTNLQAGMGGIAIGTAATTTNSSGNITIQSGNSASAGSGNITIDTGNGIVSGQLLEDYTFENGTDNYVGYTGGVVNCTQAAVAHTGTYSLAVTGTNAPSCRLDVGNNPGIPIIAGHNYYITAWVLAATVPAHVKIGMDWRINNLESFSTSQPSDNTASWIEVSALVTAPVGATSGYPIVFDDTGSSTTHYFDDLTVTDLSSISSSELNIGTANAQSITIGNTNEVAPTTIVGGNGGILINSGPNSLTESAGSFAIVGSMGSSVSTSSGTLTLSSGGGTTGGGVIVKPQADSTSAFSIQNAAATTTLFNVDTTDNEISLGTGAGASIGYTATGPWDGGNLGTGSISAQKVTTTAGGTITSMTAYIGAETAPDNLYQYAIYADNGSGTAPGTYITSSAIGTLGNAAKAWYTQPITATLAANTTYWLVYWQNYPGIPGTNNSFIYSPSMTALSVGGSATWQSGADNGMPMTFPTVATSYAEVASVYASYASAGPALTVNQYGAMTLNGAALFQDPTDSTQALQVEDSLGDILFAADTADMVIDVGGSLNVSGDITVDGHIVTGGGAPTIAAGAAACTSPTVSLSGDDTSGTISITTGTGCSSGGDLAAITFESAYGTTPRITLTPIGSGAAGLNAYLDGTSISDTGFSIGTVSTPASSTAYKWDYQVLQ